MVKAWFMAESWSGDQREEHHMQPPKFVDLDTLYKLTLVEHFKINELDPTNDKLLNSIKKDRGYSYEDEITCSKECLPNYESKLKMFFEEHLHTDEEIRLVLEGSGYFDVRDGVNDKWIRIKVEPGDLLIIPKGIYHRFTLDTNNFIKAKRFFVGEPVWTPHNRPADDMNCRKEYLNQIISC
ncbi:PREDICTED: 1,2-dihydroxy-3-keto-5-methylthiopentene dioxygenase [Diuraphis noxia]|uniref:1,2-dihydroxy-3-keto-5-methylthiopentene dioxygenase n=1 Tax=Diuraphis noxia TaxID=143948 RepID=UPI00076381F3|nr:PREDICTED: 1,2-dihydroxy-3-keto-5-methylthiopentene dioxygenase [Diuraphis noxia]